MENTEKDIFSVIGRLPAYSKLLFKLYKSRDIRKRHKLWLSMGIAYSLSPIDLIPGIIPVAGQLDNLLVMLRCLRKVLNSIDKASGKRYLEEEGLVQGQIEEDIKLAEDTLRAIGKGTVKVFSNTMKFAGYSALYTYRRLTKKKPF
jgi:uncharacterized membrane protein YkvA (DUF1232 family)